MRKILLSCFAISSAVLSQGQAIDFETLTLPKPDTFYVNYNNPGTDVGFDVGNVHLQCFYDTAYGGLWDKGFAYSNMTDSVTSGYTNMYSAKTAEGFSGSDNYVVYWDGYSTKAKISLSGDGEPPYVKSFSGFYITNSTYAYNSMQDGDFVSRKFGDTTGTGSGLPQGSYPDWFKLTIKGYDNGTLLPDTVDFYLADFRFNDNDSDYIVRNWTWVDLAPLGSVVDSLEFQLTSSDNGQYGMNTPAYFCVDNLTTLISTGVSITHKLAAKVYPNPAMSELHIEVNKHETTDIFITDLTGKRLAVYKVNNSHMTIPVAQLPNGMYMLQITNGKQTAIQRFIKQ